MQETILAGPDGQPAIDATTGQPLTMEEMLRRRGYVAYNGVVRPTGPAGAAAAPNASVVTPTSPSNDVAVAEQVAEVPMPVEAGTTVAPTPTSAQTAAPVPAPAATSGVDPAWVANPAAALEQASAETGMSVQEIEASSDDELGALLRIIGVGAATGLGWYLGNRRNPPASSAGAAVSEAMEGILEPRRAITGGNIQDGEFTVVNEAQQRRLPQAQRQLQGPTSETSRARTQARLPRPSPSRPRPRLPRIR